MKDNELENPWVSVEDRLPDTGHSKPGHLARIVTDGGAVWTTCQHCSYWNHPELYEDSQAPITHWMPLPSPPELDTEGGVK